MFKTYVPFQNTATIDGDGLPKAAETVTLFDSTTLMGASTIQNLDNVYWLTLTLFADQNATGNTFVVQYTMNGGASSPTWRTFYTSATVVGGTVFIDEIFVGNYKDVRVRYTNGAVKQTVFEVNLTIDSRERSTAGL